MNIIRKMKPLLWLLSALLSSTCLATDVYFNLADFNASPVTNRTVTLQAQSPFSGATVFYTSDANGELTVSNMAASLYFGEIKAPPQRIAFKLNITSTNLGTVNAMTVLASDSASTFPSGQVGWAAAASDRRYISTNNPITGAFTNTASMTNGVASQVGTNIFTPQAIIDLTGGTSGSYVLSNGGAGFQLTTKNWHQVQTTNVFYNVPNIVGPTYGGYSNYSYNSTLDAWTNALGYVLSPSDQPAFSASSNGNFVISVSGAGSQNINGWYYFNNHSPPLYEYHLTNSHNFRVDLNTNTMLGQATYDLSGDYLFTFPAVITNGYSVVCTNKVGNFVTNPLPTITFYVSSNANVLVAPYAIGPQFYTNPPSSNSFVVYAPGGTNSYGVVTNYIATNSQNVAVVASNTCHIEKRLVSYTVTNLVRVRGLPQGNGDYWYNPDTGNWTIESGGGVRGTSSANSSMSGVKYWIVSPFGNPGLLFKRQPATFLSATASIYNLENREGSVGTVNEPFLSTSFTGAAEAHPNATKQVSYYIETEVCP